MLAFILRRLFQSLLVMLAVALIAFAMFRFVGDPVNQLVSLDTPQEQVAQIRVGGFYKANDIEGLTRSLQQNLPIRTTQVAPDRIVISSK